MTRKDELQDLLEREAELKGPALSVYLDLEQSRPSNRNREFEVTLKTLLRSIEQPLAAEPEKLEEFTADAKPMLRLAAETKPSGLAWVGFSDASSNFLWHRELQVPMQDTVLWEPSLFIRPLVEAMDDYDRYGVILTDHTRARLFTVYLGEIEEHQGVFTPEEVRATKSLGSDQRRSQMRRQRKAHEHALSHIRDVADSMAQLERIYSFDRLLLAGPVEARTELHQLLPKRLRRKVVGSIALAMQASERNVLTATMEVESDVERNDEARLVDELLTSSAKNGRAVCGLHATLDALQQGRVWRLLYADFYAPKGGECSHCGAVTPAADAPCISCGQSVEPLEHLMNRVIQRVSEQGGKVEVVRRVAAEQLSYRAEGVGAFLRF